MAVLTLLGPVDAATAPRLAEMLQSRLCSQLARLVLDLSGVEFLGVAGVRTLVVAELRARAAEAELQLVCGGNRFEVLRKVADEVSHEYHEPMPFAVYFADRGIAFHEGSLDNSSHGCVHLNHDAAARFFRVLDTDDTVHVFSSTSSTTNATR